MFFKNYYYSVTEPGQWFASREQAVWDPRSQIFFPRRCGDVICMFCLKATTDDVITILTCQNNAGSLDNNAHILYNATAKHCIQQ